MESVIPKILGMIIGLGIAYLIFKWNKKNKQSKIYYAIAFMFLIGGLYMPFATTVDPDQEAIASSKSESISIKESKQSSIKKTSSIKAKQQSQNQKNAEAIVTYLSNELNDEYNDTFTISYDEKQNKIIMVCHDPSIAETAKQAKESKKALDDWLEFEGAMH